MSVSGTTPREDQAELDVLRIRQEFPVLSRQVHGKPLIYLDNAATAQMPRAVIDAEAEFSRSHRANVHRGVHTLSAEATAAYDVARELVRQFVNAADESEIIFTRGCTEGLNLVANAFGTPASLWLGQNSDVRPLKSGDVILLSQMEHHSGIVPWQIAAAKTGAEIKVIPMSDAGELDLDAYRSLLNEGRVKIVGCVYASNSLGTINPIKEMAALAHEAGALIAVDGAQSAPHLLTDVQDLDADFFAFSGHKVFGPTGIGALYGKQPLLDAMPPYQGGGDMIRTVSFEKTTYADLPAKFEAGTPNISGAISLGEALKFLRDIPGFTSSAESGSATYAHPWARSFELTSKVEDRLMELAFQELIEIPELKMTGETKPRVSLAAFTLDCAHPHDVGTILDSQGIAVRAGHHCCQPVMKRLKVPATTRASFAFYNTEEEVHALAGAVRKVVEIFS